MRLHVEDRHKTEILKAAENWLDMLEKEHERIVSSNIGFFNISENLGAMTELESRIQQLKSDIELITNMKKSEF